MARAHYRELRSELRPDDDGLLTLLDLTPKPSCPYFRNPVLYGVCRLASPKTAVETGVHIGRSSTLLLGAMADSSHGQLHSIDLPNVTYKLDREGSMHADLIGRRKLPGYAIPDSLRTRWTLHLGDSREKLPEVLADLGEIDLFFHDSKHTYEHMTFEFSEAWNHLTPGGFLISDDVDYNNAFADFCRAKATKSFRWGSLGITRRS